MFARIECSHCLLLLLILSLRSVNFNLSHLTIKILKLQRLETHWKPIARFSNTSRYRFYSRSISNKAIQTVNGNGQILKLAHLNLNGGLKHKIPDIECIFDHFNIDVLGLSETNQLARDSIITNNKNYNFEPAFNYCTEKTRVGVFVKKGIHYKVNRAKMNQVQIPIVWLDFKIKGEKIAIVNAYREFKLYLPRAERPRAKRSQRPHEQFERFESFVRLWETSIPEYDEIWVLGDMNYDIQRVRSSATANNTNLPLVNLIEDRVLDNGFQQLVKNKTFFSRDGKFSSVIDHIYTNSRSYGSVEAVNCSNSDHLMVMAVKTCRGRFLRKQYRLIRDFSNFDFKLFISTLLSLNLRNIIAISDPEQQVLKLTAGMNFAADMVCPVKVIHNRQFHTKWMTPRIRNAIKARDSAHRKFSALKLLGDPYSTAEAMVQFSQYKRNRNFLRGAITKAKKDYFSNQINVVSKADSKSCWRKLDNLSGRNPSFDPPITLVKDNLTIDDPKKIAEEFNSFFDNKVRKIKESLPPGRPSGVGQTNMRTNTFSFKPVSTEIVLEHIKSLSNSSAFGQDLISNRLVKNAKYILAPILADISNKCIATGTFPASWRVGKIRALYKGKGSKVDMSNYRPITQLSSMSKVLEKVMATQLYEYFEREDLFDPRQYGYRKHHSTVHAVLDLVHLVLKSKDDGETKKANSLLLDLSAAFDLVSHDTLIQKLEDYGLTPGALSLVRDYLRDRWVFTEVETMESDMVKVNQSVPQGSILGPLLFIIFTANITTVDEHPKIGYCDDSNCVVLAKDGPSLRERTEEAMEALVDFYAGIELKLNKSKTEIVNHNFKTVQHSITVDRHTGETLSTVSEARMLGIRLDSDLSFSRHVENLVKDVNLRLATFARISKVAGLRARALYGHGLLLSIFHFGISCYGSACQTRMEKVRVAYDKCVKAIYRPSSHRISAAKMREDLQILSLEQLRDSYDICLVAKMIETGKPKELARHIVSVGREDLRSQSNGNVKVDTIPKTQKLRDSFLYRSVRKYNSIPVELKKLASKPNFSKRVKTFLLTGIVTTQNPNPPDP